MTTDESTTWKSYEEVARHLLETVGHLLGLKLERVEGKQTLVGESGANWEIDAKGVKAQSGAIVVIECRRYTDSRVKQSAVASLAWTISDVGASGGIIVTPIGVQKGGQIVAQSADIEIVHLDANATPTDFRIKFLEKVVVGASANLHVTVTLTAEAEVVKADTSEQ
ncbi:restriction endonuclease [Mycobacterium sp. SM1]|uniref:restriction endonuclease n=1 Tax=Mycobacterium sp. SM1 TaxID=2816243 RepID=UPI001BCF5708|nr:restriction endonuclease [Mycobacterium sp. SM1]MBS4729698.1 restriction endonuclease [Mycobacterium sp. SM1]